eukprot:CCRYP_002743-RC/>CCRYP_002743-RC protein AED:0.47 eAED:1.00 QI:0/0/0/1/0/0/2/0/92
MIPKSGTRTICPQELVFSCLDFDLSFFVHNFGEFHYSLAVGYFDRCICEGLSTSGHRLNLRISFASEIVFLGSESSLVPSSKDDRASRCLED